MAILTINQMFGDSMTVVSINGTSTSRSSQLVPFQNGRIGVDNPKWSDQIKRCEDATTPFSGTLDVLTYLEPITFTVQWTGLGFKDKYTYNGLGFMFGGNIDPPSGLSLPSDTRTDNLFLRRVRNVNVQFEGSTFLGELGDTIRMFRNPLRGIRDLLRRHRDLMRAHNQRPGTREYARAAAGTWLETSFGILPFVNDMQNLRDALIPLGDRPATVRVNARREWSDVTLSQNYELSFGTPAIIRIGKKWVVRNTYEVRGVVKADGSTAEYWGFDPGSLALAAWEVYPYSFLVDYIIPIGNTLEALATRRTSLAWSNRTQRVEGITILRHIRTSLNPGTWSYTERPKRRLGGCRRSKKMVGRNSYYPTFSLPSITFAPSFHKLINSIALLVVHRS